MYIETIILEHRHLLPNHVAVRYEPVIQCGNEKLLSRSCTNVFLEAVEDLQLTFFPHSLVEASKVSYSPGLGVLFVLL